jgi:hypothetical protein
VVLTVAACLLLRLVVRESDPKSLLHALFVGTFQAVNRVLPWYRLPTFLAVLNLGALRDVLRAKNLHDTSGIPVTRPEGLRAPPPFKAEYLSEREEDGFYNELRPDKVDMGSASLTPEDETNSSDFTISRPGARFGRNIPVEAIGPLPSEKVTEPSPRLVSSNLLARPQGSFTPASTLNLLAAAWIQFQVHAESHWWDGSEIYGSSKTAADRLRSRDSGKLRVGGPGSFVAIAKFIRPSARAHRTTCNSEITIRRGEARPPPQVLVISCGPMMVKCVLLYCTAAD